MKRLLLLLLLWNTAFGATHVLSFDPVSGATAYRAFFSSTQAGATFATLDTATSQLSFDDSSFPKPYYVCVEATDGSVWSPCSVSVYMGLGNPQHVWPNVGWKSVTGLTWDKNKALRVGGFTWPGPVWAVTGGSYSGVPVPAPIIEVNGTYFCDWPYGLAQCEYQP